MKTKFTAIAALSLTVLSTAALAQCPTSQPVEKIVNCIVEENASTPNDTQVMFLNAQPAEVTADVKKAVVGAAAAQCSANLTAEQLTECIVSQNAGYWYGNSDDTENGVSAHASAENNTDSASLITVSMRNVVVKH